MEINVEDYLDRDEIKDIIKNQIRYIVERDAERLLTNSAYYVVFKAVDEALDNSAKELIKAKAIAIINDLSEYSVFKKKDAWETEDSIAYQVLQEAMNENKDLIKQKVREAIENRDYEKDIQNSMDYISEGLFEIMRRGLENNV
jgi:hypothetical protein